MKTLTPLFYASYAEPRPMGPLLKVKLLPIRKLLRLSVGRIKSELKIDQYLRLYTILFAVMGLGIGISLLILRLL